MPVEDGCGNVMAGNRRPRKPGDSNLSPAFCGFLSPGFLLLFAASLLQSAGTATIVMSVTSSFGRVWKAKTVTFKKS
jgi:hypothetical protein